MKNKRPTREIVVGKTYRWAIAYRWKVRGNRVTMGLYVGQWLTRKDAIREHVHNLYSDKIRVGLCSEQAAWQRRREEGDIAVKVAIYYGVPKAIK